MIEKHQGLEERAHTFWEAWGKLERAGDQQLTTRVGTRFVARAAVTTKGPRKSERVIRYLLRGLESGRSYECCWEHYYNCNRTRIGMYSASVDEWIEQNGGSDGLNLEGRDLSALDLGRDAIRDELKARGISEPEDYPAWVHVIAGNAEGINLRRTILEQADLQGANLRWADLQEAKLWNASLRGANLRWANLQESDLRSMFSSLEGAHLFGARLERSKLTKKQLGRGIGEDRDSNHPSKPRSRLFASGGRRHRIP